MPQFFLRAEAPVPLDMTPEEIPQDLLDILDSRAGRVHNRRGTVVTTLAEILTRYDEIRGGEPGANIGGTDVTSVTSDKA